MGKVRSDEGERKGAEEQTPERGCYDAVEVHDAVGSDLADYLRREYGVSFKPPAGTDEATRRAFDDSRLPHLHRALSVAARAVHLIVMMHDAPLDDARRGEIAREIDDLHRDTFPVNDGGNTMFAALVDALDAGADANLGTVSAFMHAARRRLRLPPRPGPAGTAKDRAAATKWIAAATTDELQTFADDDSFAAAVERTIVEARRRSPELAAALEREKRNLARVVETWQQRGRGAAGASKRSALKKLLHSLGLGLERAAGTLDSVASRLRTGRTRRREELSRRSEVLHASRKT